MTHGVTFERLSVVSDVPSKSAKSDVFRSKSSSRTARCLTLSGLTLWNTSRGRGGGRSAHPLIMAIGACFHYFLLARALSLDVKGQNLKAQLSTSENIALRAFGKTAIFCKSPQGYIF